MKCSMSASLHCQIQAAPWKGWLLYCCSRTDVQSSPSANGMNRQVHSSGSWVCDWWETLEASLCCKMGFPASLTAGLLGSCVSGSDALTELALYVLLSIILWQNWMETAANQFRGSITYWRQQRLSLKSFCFSECKPRFLHFCNTFFCIWFASLPKSSCCVITVVPADLGVGKECERLYIFIRKILWRLTKTKAPLTEVFW